MNEYIKLSKELQEKLHEAQMLVITMRHEFLTPEHILFIFLSSDNSFRMALEAGGADVEKMKNSLDEYLGGLEKVPEDADYHPDLSFQVNEVLGMAAERAISSSRDEVEISHFMMEIFELEDSLAGYLLEEAVEGDTVEFLCRYLSITDVNHLDHSSSWSESELNKKENPGEEEAGWKKYLTCVNNHLDGRNPLIGREAELERTVRILCRKEKNNPLHVGEPGVGKTALVYGLASLIEEGKVPERLKGAKIYSLEVGDLLAGTQFRGDFEKRLKSIMEGLEKEKNAILYIDEIHNIIGAGATGEGSMDASNMLKPYLERGLIRFIGSTTYDEYKRYFSRSKGFVRRFSQIDIYEPSIEECITILERVKENYESHHGVKYTDDAVRIAVEGSARYITGSFLPDKAIDVIDEAGAYRQTHPLDGGEKIVDSSLIEDILAKMCKVDSISFKENESERYYSLEERIKSRIFGQNRAVEVVSEAILMSKAGLSDETKPLASLLFVGPTGVGKTELAKTLAEELGIGFIRFDMSEYAEKHTVAKLIGAPAGYVGYDDGGLLTDAVRKTPDCVLLLDEVEKAHPDIYNILLQVMDYASLTDNRGNKADFRNVVLIMTSNAGARYASQANVGFGSVVTAGTAMMAQVKKTFQPEFLNRLSQTVVFNDMDVDMAGRILDRKLSILQEKTRNRNIELLLTQRAKDFILSKGYSRQYGARELERTLNSLLKPMLTREILFGQLKNGGKAIVELENETLILKTE